MLESRMPHALITSPNPVFDYEIQHVHWPRSRADLKRYSLIVLVACHMIIAAGWLLERLSYNVGGVSFRMSSLIYLFIVVGAAVAALSANLYYVLTTIGTIHQQIESGEWDMLRVTALRDDSILTAKYAVAQVRAWRMMSVEAALRIAGLVCIGLLNLSVLGVLVVTLPVSWYVGVLAATCIIEPLWRMQAIVALGIAIGAAIRNTTFALLTALAAVLILQAAEAVLIGVLWYIAFNLLDSRLYAFCILPIASLIMPYVLYRACNAVRARSLRYALVAAAGTK